LQELPTFESSFSCEDLKDTEETKISSPMTADEMAQESGIPQEELTTQKSILKETVNLMLKGLKAIPSKQNVSST